MGINYKKKGKCLACGLKTKKTEWAHIEPRRNGGENKKENLHELCQVCHYESETKTGQEYMDWFNSGEFAMKKLMESISKDSKMKVIFDYLFDRKSIAKMTSEALRKKRKNGEITNHPPFGYKIENGKLKINKQEMGTICLIKELKASGISNRGIARHLVAKKIENRKGGKWCHNFVGRILKKCMDNAQIN